MHATACAGKAFETWYGADTLEACRRSMGGTAYRFVFFFFDSFMNRDMCLKLLFCSHTHSQYSGIPSLIEDYGVLTTGGGDNIVLAQQAARYLVKQFNRSSIALEGTSIAYLAANVAPVALQPVDLLNLPSLLAVIGSLTRIRLATAIEVGVVFYFFV
jgi:hypothetical protein